MVATYNGTITVNGERWRNAATLALAAMGLNPPFANEQGMPDGGYADKPASSERQDAATGRVIHASIDE